MHTEAQTTFDSALEEPSGAPPKPLTEAPVGRNADQGITPDAGLVLDDSTSTTLRITFAEETHKYVIEYIQLADRKAIFFFAGCTALLAYLQRLGLSNTWLVGLPSWRLVQVLAFLATVGLILCAIACIMVVIPRMGATGGGMIYFGSIAKRGSATDYVIDVTRRCAQELCREKLEHTYDLAVVCNRKYGVLRLAQWFGAVASLAALILFVAQSGPTS